MKRALFWAILGIFLVLGANTVSAYEIVDNMVVENNAKATIAAWPHTVYYPEEPINIMIKSKIYEGPIDVAFGFDSEIALPKLGEYKKENNWIDVSDNFNSVYYDYMGADKWYYFKGFNVTANEQYNVRISLKFNEPGSGKYWVCIKPSDKTISEAISENMFMCLDPWFDSNYTFRQEIDTTCNGCTNNVTMVVPVNGSSLTIGSSIENFWCNVTSNTTGQYVYYNNYSDYICAAASQIPLLVERGNGSNYLNPFQDAYISYVMNASSGTTVPDVSPNGYDGTLTGAGGIAFADDGTISRGVNHATTDDYIAISGSATETHQNLTISVWIKMSCTISPGVDCDPGSNNGDRLYRWTGGSPDDVFTDFTTGKLGTANFCDDTELATTTAIWSSGTTYHIVLRYNAIDDVADIWVNGVKEDSCNALNTLSNTNLDDLIIGARPTSWGGMLGVYDNFFVYSNESSLTDDEIIFMYEMISNQNAIGDVQTEDFRVTILSPEATTYTSTSVPLLYSFDVDDGSTCASSLYNINGQGNTSLGCSNSTVTFNESLGTSQTLTVFVTNSNGTTRTASVTYTVVFGGNFTINIYDEIDGTSYNTSDMTLTSYCSNQTEIATLTNWTSNVVLNCSFNRIQLTIVDSQNRTTTRFLIPTQRNGTLEFYMINQSRSTQIDQTWQIYDLSGIYGEGIIQLTKVIRDIGTKTITQQRIDAEDKVFMDLIQGETYIITIFDSNRGNERSIGGVQTTSDTSVNIEVSNVAFQSNSRIPARDVFITYTWDKDAAYIRALYNDTLQQTTSVSFNVYNSSNVSQVLSSQTSTSSLITFTYNVPNINQSYIVNVTAIHSRYKVLTDVYEITFSETGKYNPNDLDALGYGIWKAVAAGLLCMFVLLAFSKRNAKFGLSVFSMMIAAFMYFGWFSETPQVSWLIVTLLLITSVIGIFGLRRRFN